MNIYVCVYTQRTSSIRHVYMYVSASKNVGAHAWVSGAALTGSHGARVRPQRPVGEAAHRHNGSHKVPGSRSVLFCFLYSKRCLVLMRLMGFAFSLKVFWKHLFPNNQYMHIFVCVYKYIHIPTYIGTSISIHPTYIYIYICIHGSLDSISLQQILMRFLVVACSSCLRTFSYS